MSTHTSSEFKPVTPKFEQPPQRKKPVSNEAFQCEECGKTFQHRGSIINHMMIHNEKKFNCPMCGKTCSRRANMRRHAKAIHGMSDEAAAKLSTKLVRETPAPRRATQSRADNHRFKAPTPAMQACPIPSVCVDYNVDYPRRSFDGVRRPYQPMGFHGDSRSSEQEEVRELRSENMMLRRLLSNINHRNTHLQEALLMDRSIAQMEQVLSVPAMKREKRDKPSVGRPDKSKAPWKSSRLSEESRKGNWNVSPAAITSVAPACTPKQQRALSRVEAPNRDPARLGDPLYLPPPVKYGNPLDCIDTTMTDNNEGFVCMKALSGYE